MNNIDSTKENGNDKYPHQNQATTDLIFSKFLDTCPLLYLI
jgi:hypothetical protein